MSAAEYKSAALMAIGKQPSDVRESLEARLESQRGTGTSLDIGALFSPGPITPQFTCSPISSLSHRRPTIRASDGLATFHSSTLRPVPRTWAAPSYISSRAQGGLKRKRQHDENWSQRSTTREPSSDEDEASPCQIKSEPQTVVLPVKPDPSPRSPVTLRSRIPLQPTSPNLSVERAPPPTGKAATPPSWSSKVDDSATRLDSSRTPASPAKPCALARTPVMVPAEIADPSSSDKLRLGQTSSPPRPTATTLRHVLQSSLVHLPSAHDVALRPKQDGTVTPAAGDQPLRRAQSSPERLRRSRSSSHLDRLDLTRTESFRKMLLQSDRDAVLLLDPDCPRFQHDLDTYRNMTSAVSSPRAKVRVLSAWCVREQGRALDGSWERFRLAEL
jgi:hypothetical protein